MIDLSSEPHSISLVEWLAGFVTMQGLFVTSVLLIYLFKNRDQAWQPHYCIAIWFVVALLGGTTTHGWIWIAIFARPELDTAAKVEEAYPAIGAVPWEVGNLITAIAIVMLCRAFGEAYIGRFTWIPATVISALVPLLSMWYVA
jgi:hypothetical protein